MNCIYFKHPHKEGRSPICLYLDQIKIDLPPHVFLDNYNLSEKEHCERCKVKEEAGVQI